MHRNWRLIVGGIALGIPLVLVACQADLPSALQQETVVDAKPSTVVSGRGPLSVLEVLEQNRNQCVERVTDRDAKGKVIRWNERRSSVQPAFDKQRGKLQGYALMTFDRKSGEQTSQVDCVLEDDKEAIPFMKARFGRAASVASPFASGLPIAFAWGDGDVQCSWDGWTLECGGDSCVRGYSMRTSEDTDRAAASTGGAALGIPQGAWGSWTCGPGCAVSVGSESSVYSCPGGGSGGIDDGGGGGGDSGSHNCEPGYHWSDSIPIQPLRGILGRSSLCYPNSPPIDSTDETVRCVMWQLCSTQFTATDSQHINAAKALFKTTGLSAPYDAQCAELRGRLNTALAANRIRRGGAYALDFFGFSVKDSHDAHTNIFRTQSHIDANILDDNSPLGLFALASHLLHEAAHLIDATRTPQYYTHPPGDPNPTTHMYSSYPFNLTNVSTTGAVCVNAP